MVSRIFCAAPRVSQRLAAAGPRFATHAAPAPAAVSSLLSQQQRRFATDIAYPEPVAVQVDKVRPSPPLLPSAIGRAPVVFLHGLLGNGGNFRRHARLCKLDRPRWIVDMRNHGGSPHDSDASIPAMMVDLHKALEDRGMPREKPADLVLFGHSLGGRVAMACALSPLLRDRIGSLIVVDVSPNYSTNRNVPATAETANGGWADLDRVFEAMKSVPLDRLTPKGGRRAADKALGRFGIGAMTRAFLLTNLTRQRTFVEEQPSLEERLQTLQEDVEWSWRANLDVLHDHLQRGVWTTFNYGALRDAAGGPFEKPVLFIGGANSTYIQPKHHEQIRELFPNAHIEMVPDAGHWVHVDQPDRFQELVEQFVKDNLPEGDEGEIRF